MVCLRESYSLYILQGGGTLPPSCYSRKYFGFKLWSLAACFKASCFCSYEISQLYRSGKAISRSSQKSDEYAIEGVGWSSAGTGVILWKSHPCIHRICQSVLKIPECLSWWRFCIWLLERYICGVGEVTQRLRAVTDLPRMQVVTSTNASDSTVRLKEPDHHSPTEAER